MKASNNQKLSLLYLPECTLKLSIIYFVIILIFFAGMCARDLCYYPDNQQYWMDIALEVCRGEVQLFPNRN